MVEVSVAAEARITKLKKVQKEVIPDRGSYLIYQSPQHALSPGGYTKVPSNTLANTKSTHTHYTYTCCTVFILSMLWILVERIFIPMPSAHNNEITNTLE